MSVKDYERARKYVDKAKQKYWKKRKSNDSAKHLSQESISQDFKRNRSLLIIVYSTLMYLSIPKIFKAPANRQGFFYECSSLQKILVYVFAVLLCHTKSIRIFHKTH